MITNEGNISNDERDYRAFAELINAYAPGVSVDDIKVQRTRKGNYKIFTKDGKFVKLVSKNILSDRLILTRGISVENCD